MKDRSDLFHEFLKFFWLRPENAIMFGVRADAYASTRDLFDLAERSVDVSCGDGVFSYIVMGGRFTSAPDQFRAVSFDETFRTGNYDAFDHFDESYLIEVAQPPTRRYTIGADWKENMISKARVLDFYDELIVHDNNKPLPLPDADFQYVYTNSSYWVTEFEKHLADLARLLAPGGHLVLQMRTNKIRDYSLQAIAPGLGDRFHEIAEAGRTGTWRGLRSRGEVLSILDKIDGLKVVREEPVLGESIAQIWNMGLRPFFNPLVKMANALDPQYRTEIKKEWCLIFEEMFSEYVETYECTQEEAFEFLYVLEKQPS